jgi:fumarate reductase subunit C
MNTYRRPMSGWWQKNPFYRWYMLREASCVFITAYALVLLVGLYRLGEGRAAFESWVAALRAPASLVFHLVALFLVAYHSWTWFKIMPKTMPRLPIPDAAIVIGAMAAVLAASAAIVWVALA